MKFRELGVDGCFEILLEPRSDERGWFSRAFCTREFQELGLDSHIAQVNSSFSQHAGTLRGMHFQSGASAETKVVRSIRGAVYDVVIDLRRGSPTSGRWTSLELSEDLRNAIYIPKGCAHGVMTLVPNSELLYAVSAPYDPSAEGGVRWDDPAFQVEWPSQPLSISAKDQQWAPWNGDWQEVSQGGSGT